MSKFELGENVWHLPKYEFRALRYAEHYGITEYKTENNIMIYEENYPNEGKFVHKINLDTFKEVI